MGDLSVVRGSINGAVRAIKVTTSAAVEEGDLVVESGGTVAKVASDAVSAAGIMLEGVASGGTGMMAVLTQGMIIEGPGVSTHVMGDSAGILVSTGTITFDEDDSHIFGHIYKALGDSDHTVQVVCLSTVAQL